MAEVYFEDKTAGAYLTQARAALLDCGRANKLYGRWRDHPEVAAQERLRAHVLAQGKQLEFARTSILFSALAAEAYINRFLEAGLPPADFEAVEKLGTADKYVLGPELVLGHRLFERGAEPAQSIDALFKLRHKLVHPKGRRVKFDGGTLMDERFEHFSPQAAANFIVRVAEAENLLAEQAAPPRMVDPTVATVIGNREKILQLGAALREGLPAPPKRLLAKAVAADKPAGGDGPTLGLAGQADLKFQPLDPLKVPLTVPQEPRKLLDSLIDTLQVLPGTATGPAPPEES
jgi:hypothetical protein